MLCLKVWQKFTAHFFTVKWDVVRRSEGQLIYTRLHGITLRKSLTFMATGTNIPKLGKREAT
jgi:hypothetical protein